MEAAEAAAVEAMVVLTVVDSVEVAAVVAPLEAVLSADGPAVVSTEAIMEVIPAALAALVWEAECTMVPDTTVEEAVSPADVVRFSSSSSL